MSSSLILAALSVAALLTFIIQGRRQVPNRNRVRGYELERSCTQFWEKQGAEVKRVLSSGAYKHFSDDLAGDIKLGPYVVEAKRKKSGFKFLYDALDQDDVNDMLVLKQEMLHQLKDVPKHLF